MANNYTDMTGILKLQKVTPVIKALFGGFNLDESNTANGEAFIAIIAEETDCSWSSVYDTLDDLAKELKLVEADVFENVDVVLKLLTTHIKPENLSAMESIIEAEKFENASISVLFAIAKLLDDGHGLTSCKLESSWRCSQPRLFEFGGAGTVIGTHYSLDESSSDSAAFGEVIEVMLANGDLDLAADTVFNRVTGILSGIHDANKRVSVTAKLAELLLQPTGK